MDVCPRCGGAGFLRRDLPLDHPDFGKAMPCDCVRAETGETAARAAAALQLAGAADAPDLRQPDRARPQHQPARPRAVPRPRRATPAPSPRSRRAGCWSTGPPAPARRTSRPRSPTAASSAASRRCSSSCRTCWTTCAPPTARTARSAYDALLEQVRNAPVLILDDLGTQSAHRLGAGEAVPDPQPPLQRPAADRRHDQPEHRPPGRAPAHAPHRPGDRARLLRRGGGARRRRQPAGLARPGAHPRDDLRDLRHRRAAPQAGGALEPGERLPRRDGASPRSRRTGC